MTIYFIFRKIMNLIQSDITKWQDQPEWQTFADIKEPGMKSTSCEIVTIEGHVYRITIEAL